MEKGFYHPVLGYWQTIGGDPALDDYPSGTIQVPLKPSAAHEWQNGEWVYIEPKQETEPIPNEISRRQFFQQLALQGIIPEGDALAALTSGDIPAPLQAIIDILPIEEQFNAKMLVAGASTFNRTHPLAEIVRQALKWTVEQRGEFWLAASRL